MKNDNGIAVIGMGLMGCSITSCLLRSGHSVKAVVDQYADIDLVRRRIFTDLEELEKESELVQTVEAILENLTFSNDLAVLADFSLVIESIDEEVDKKKQLFRELEAILAEDAIIASNTSAIPITELQNGLMHPERLFGLHWGEPAHAMKFMEVICGDFSDPQYAERLMDLAKSWGKEPSLLKKDIRGFISNRLMYAMIREGLYLVENGYASIEDIDRACRNDLGHWITFAGPFRFMDLTGVSAYLKVMEDLFPELSNSTVVPEFVKEVVEAGGNGLSTGKGFYNYTQESVANWERLFVEFTLHIKKLSNQYPQNVGDLK